MKQGVRNGVEFIFDMNNPRLQVNKLMFPLQAVGHDLCSFSLGLTRGGNRPGLAMQAAANPNT